MTDKQFAKLKEKIEIGMTELKMLQKKFHEQTGKDHVMPLYLSMPDHLQKIIDRYKIK
jgi:hypothetical protein